MAAVVTNTPDPNINYETKECAGCRGSVDDGDGVVVAFGNSLWHIDCFNCAKCGKRVSADNNILLLSDGSPMCTSCSYNCAVCKKPISHEAIMTGDESYHASCFACRQCRRHIGELVFAKTSQGIYCMACHNERVARSKRHRIKREQMAREKEKGIKEQSSFLRENGTTTPEPPGTPSNTNTVANAVSTPDPSTAVNRSAKRVSRQFASLKTYSDLVNAPPVPLDPRAGKSAMTPPLPSPTITTTHASPPSNHANGNAKQDRDSLQLPTSLQPGRRPSDEQPHPEPGPSSRPGSSSGAGRPEVSSPNRLSPTSDGHRHSYGSAGQHPERASSRSPSPSPGNGSRSPRARSPIPDMSPPPPMLTPQRPGYQRSASSMDNHHGHATNSQIEKLVGPPRSHSLPMSQESQQKQQGSSPLVTSPGPMTDSGRRSPHTPSGHSIFAQQQSAGLARAGTPMRDLPSLPQEVDEDDGRSSEPFTEEEDEEDSREGEEQEKEEEKPALPPIEFGGDGSGFDDLLMFGTAEEKEKRAKEREERRESGKSEASFLSSTAVSSSSRPTSGSSSLASPISSTTKASKRNSRSPLPLNLLPSRSASLRKQPPAVLSPRKTDPEAIVMSDTFDVDMARDTDESESSNAASSPVLTPQTFDLASYYEEEERSVKRPGSAGTGERELSVKGAGRARSSSTTALTPTSTVTLIPTTPTPARSVSSPMVSTPKPSDSNSNVDLTRSTSTASTSSNRKMDTSELVVKRLRSALDEAVESGTGNVKIDREFLEMVYVAVLHAREREREGGDVDVQGKQYLHNLTVAQEQYDAELRARREAEAEVTRLKVQLSGQAARLTELSAGERKRDVAEQMSKDYSESLHGLERDLSKLKAERELMAAEVEELVGVKKGTQPPAEQTLQRSLTKRFDNLKSQYKKELEPLVQQRERLLREINELKEERNICLEQTTALTARNEELAALIAQMSRQVESTPVIASQAPTPAPIPPTANSALNSSTLGRRQISGPITVIQGPSTPNPKTHGPLPALPSSLLQTPSTTLGEEHDNKATLSSRKLFVKGGKEIVRQQEKEREAAGSPPEKEKDGKHNFQLSTLLRVARCDHCGDKMWGTQLRCTLCHIGLHNRCHALFSSTCAGEPRAREATPSPAPLQPSMFGRDLIEQVRADSAKEHRDIPIIVEKCITAKMKLAMDYEGIYRKTGGSSESKAITALFERGNCENIDLINCDVYTDISSVTSVLKTYFRQLPNPLLTHALHEAFVGAASQRDPQSKAHSLSSLIFQLPSEHFHTLRYLMLHLNRVQQRVDENLMNARNLGVVFGPTLMRSNDPNREFADMAGKALAVEWLIENAPNIFRDLGDS